MKANDSRKALSVTRRDARVATRSCIAEAIVLERGHPLIDNPTLCTGEPLVSHPGSADLSGPCNISEATHLPADRHCLNEVFKPVLFARPTTNEADSASGLDSSSKNPVPRPTPFTLPD